MNKSIIIKQANMIEDGKFIPKWKYDDIVKDRNLHIDEKYSLQNPEVKVIINGHRYNIT